MPKRIPTWSVLFIGFVVLATGAGMAATVIDVPYYAYEPGPVHELDQFVEAGATGQLDGEFLMLTVALSEVTAMEFAMAMVDPAVDLVRRERVRPVDISPEQYRESNLQAMNESKNTAIFVALDYLGYEVTGEPHGLGVSPDGQWIYVPTADGGAPWQSGPNGGRLLVVNAQTLKLAQVINTGRGPHHLSP